MKTHNPDNNCYYPTACYVVGILLLICLIVAAFAITIFHLDIVTFLKDDKLMRAHFICGTFGMLGASMAAIRKYYKTLITYSTNIANNNNVSLDWSWGWVYYYLTRPLLGAILGALTYTLSFIGFQIISSGNQIDFSPQGQYLLYSIALISGFSVSHVLDRLENVSKQMFQAIEKDN